MPGSIFVSYSHQDGPLVKPVVGLLRATDDLVFQDVDNIQPGKKWRGQIEKALHAAYLVIVFWCYHSSKSAEVRAEYRWALACGKHVLPVLLDTTPLPEELNEFQWVDFRQLVGSLHRSYRRWITWGAVLTLMLMVGFWFYLQFPRLGGDDSGPRPEMSEPPPRPSPELPQPVPREPLSPGLPRFIYVIFAVILVATVTALVSWMVKRRGRRRAGVPPSNYQQLMAEKSREELFRRGIDVG